MEWLIVAGIVVLLWVLFSSLRQSKSRSNKGDDGVRITVESSVGSSRSYPEEKIDCGEVYEESGRGFVINPKSPLPLTLAGCGINEAKSVKSLLDGQANWHRNGDEIAHLFAEHNIECLELTDFIQNTKIRVEERIEAFKSESGEWQGASEADQRDLEKEFQKHAIDSLAVKPSSDRALLALIFGEPSDVTADDDLIALFNGNNELYGFYISRLGRGSGAVKVPADDYWRKNWESLVELDLAIRGKDIPVKSLLESLRMKDINEYFESRLEKKLTRKAKALEYAASQPDVLDVLSKHVSFRELFQVKVPKGIDVSQIRKCYEFASAQAALLADTYVSGYRTLSTLADAKDFNYDGWEIDAEDCCNGCDKLHGKRTKRKLSKLPPFHVGCTCSLEGAYDD